MVDHYQSAAPTQQVLCGLHDLGQRYGEFMPGNGLLRVGIEAPVADGTIGRITHHGAKDTRGKERRHLADVALHNTDAVLQTIADDIVLGEYRERALEFQPNKAHMWEAACQQERYDTTASAQVNEWVGSRDRHKVCQ